MSDSMYFPEEGFRERGIKRLRAKVTFGSASVSASAGTGVTVTRTAAGTYTATLADSFVEYLGAKFDFNANSSSPVDLFGQTYDVSMSGKTIKFKLLAKALTGSATWDVADLADGAQESKDITVTGAALGDIAIGSMGVDVVDLIVTANVTATNTVTLVAANETGGNVNLASTTARAMVIPALPVATDPTSGAVLYIEFLFKDSSVTY